MMLCIMIACFCAWALEFGIALTRDILYVWFGFPPKRVQIMRVAGKCNPQRGRREKLEQTDGGAYADLL